MARAWGPWTPTSGQQNGASWVELFAVFQALGGGHCDQSDDQHLVIKANFSRQLATFVHNARQITSMFASPGDKIMFQPARSKQHRLAQYGVNKHIPCICAHLCIHISRHKSLHEFLTTLMDLMIPKKVNFMRMLKNLKKVEKLMKINENSVKTPKIMILM